MAAQTERHLTGVAETLLMPLYARSVESARPDALLRDEIAVALVARWPEDFARIKQVHMDEEDRVVLMLRNREFDRQAREFLARHPDGTVVHIGCGLDARFPRVDNGRVEWYDLDLPAVISLRREALPERPRYHLIASSAFETAWLDLLRVHTGRPFLFLAEAVFLYFPESRGKALVLNLKGRFPGAELVCDAMTPFMVSSLNLELALSKMSARLEWRLKHGRDVEGWGEGIRLLSEWFYFDRPEPRLGSMRLMRFIPPLARGVGIFHYQLGQTPG